MRNTFAPVVPEIRNVVPRLIHRLWRSPFPKGEGFCVLPLRLLFLQYRTPYRASHRLRRSPFSVGEGFGKTSLRFWIDGGQASGNFPFAGDGPEGGAQGQDQGHGGGHEAVGEGRLAAVALDIVFHVSGYGEQQQCASPEAQDAGLPAAGFAIAQGKHQQHPQDRQQAQDLDHADKAVAAEEQGIIPGGVQHRLGAPVVEKEEEEQIPVLFPPAPPLPEKQHRKAQEDQGRDHGLQQEGGKPEFLGAGGGV